MPQRRSIILIDRKFQLRFAFYVCSWLFALSLIYPAIIYNLFDFFLRYASLDPNGPTVAAIQATRRELLSIVIILQLVFLSVTFLLSIFLSHKIAGPIYKLKKFMNMAKEGNLNEALRFRKADHFKDVAEVYNDMTQGLKDLLAQDREKLDQGAKKLERAVEHSSGDGKRQAEEALQLIREVREHLPHA